MRPPDDLLRPARRRLSRAYVFTLGLAAGAGWYTGLPPLPLVAWVALEGGAALAGLLPRRRPAAES